MEATKKRNPKTPVPKVQAAGVGGAFATLVIIGLDLVGVDDIPPEAAAALATVFAFGAGYLRPAGG